MAPGKKPVNIFKLNRGDDPREVFNWRLWFAVFSFGLMGAARGVDEGLISGTFNTGNFQSLLGLDTLDDVTYANIKGDVSAMVQIGSVGGALLAFLLCDRIGRLWATRQLCLVWILGIVIFMTNNGRLGQVYAGRFVAGLGIGQATVIAPVYLSEISPKSVRGLCTCAFSGSVYIGIMLAYFASWGSSLHIDPTSKGSWLVPTSLHIMFAGIILSLSFFNYESPRYLIKCGKVQEAVQNLARVRQLPQDNQLIRAEIAGIQYQLAEEQEATMGQGALGYLKEMFLMPNNLYRIYIGLGSQLLSQWSGAGSITLYAPDFFALLGTKGQNEKLFATAIFGGRSYSLIILIEPAHPPCPLPSGLFPFPSTSPGDTPGADTPISCQIRVGNYLRPFSSRCDRTQARTGHRHLPPSHQYGIRRSVSHGHSGPGEWRSSYAYPKPCWDRGYCLHLYQWVWLGHGLELYAVPPQRGDLSSPDPCGFQLIGHVFPFREPVRQLTCCSGDAVGAVPRWAVTTGNFLVFRGYHVYRRTMGLVDNP
jgi:MFS family permease